MGVPGGRNRDGAQAIFEGFKTKVFSQLKNTKRASSYLGRRAMRTVLGLESSKILWGGSGKVVSEVVLRTFWGGGPAVLDC